MQFPFQLSILDSLAAWIRPAARSVRRPIPRVNDERLLSIWHSLRAEFFPHAPEIDSYHV